MLQRKSGKSNKVLVFVLVLSLVIAQMSFQGSLLLKGVDYIVARLTIDDTYYYLQTAWNTSRLGFISFDGIHSTNGVQFSWFWILTLLASLMPSKTAMVFATLILCMGLNALCYVAIWRIGDVLGRPILAIAMSVFWFNLNIVGGRWYLTGMENSLHALVLWMIAAHAMPMLRSEQPVNFQGLAGFTSLLVLNVWCRLDAAILSVLMFTAVIYSVKHRVKLGTILSCLGLAVLGATVLFIGYYWMARYFLPVSGLVKTQHFHWDIRLFSDLTSRGFDLTTQIGYLLWHISRKQYHGVAGPLVLGMIASCSSMVSLQSNSYPAKVLRKVWWIYALSSLFQLTYWSGMGIFAEYGVWYQSPYFVFAVMTMGIFIDSVLHILRKAELLSPEVAWTASIVLGIVFLAFISRWCYRWISDSDYRNGVLYARFQLAEWIEQNVSEDAVLASFNAGELGYFSSRSVINLDGLMNDFKYYRSVIRGQVPLTDYLSENKVSYFVDYRIPGELWETSTVIRTYGFENGHILYLLQLSETASQ